MSPRNRRSTTRLNGQVGVTYYAEGRVQRSETINLSETGARLVLRGVVPHEIDFTLDSPEGPLPMRGEKVWEERLAGASVVGVRFI